MKPKMKPILFNTEMVRAQLKGQKTATRRVAKLLILCGDAIPQDTEFFISAESGLVYWGSIDRLLLVDGKPVIAPYRPGDILYVRETWREQPLRYSREDGYSDFEFQYRADFTDAENELYGRRGGQAPRPWRPSIHMPKKAARIFHHVTNVRVERLQDITDKQALAEGVPDDCDYPLESPVYCPVCKGGGLIGAVHPVSLGYMEVDCPHCDTPRKRFLNLWDSTVKMADRVRYGWNANPWVWVIEFERITKEEAYNVAKV